MRLLLQYLHLHRKSAVLLTVCALLFALVFFLYHLPVEAVLYACGLCLIAFIVLAGIDFSRFRARHLALELLRWKLAAAIAFGFSSALCATRVCRFSEEKLGQMLSVEFQAMMLLVKSKAEDAS